MAYLVIEINTSDFSIADFNSKCQNPTNPHDAVVGCRNLLEGILAGATSGTVKVVSKDSSTSISTSGSGSESETYSFA